MMKAMVGSEQRPSLAQWKEFVLRLSNVPKMSKKIHGAYWFLQKPLNITYVIVAFNRFGSPEPNQLFQVLLSHVSVKT